MNETTKITRIQLEELHRRGEDITYLNLRGADLRWANLYRASLCGANLRGADLRGADLREANLYRASLYGASLYEANLREANLDGANLDGITVNWNSHQLISAILVRAAETDSQYEFAAVVRVRFDVCWSTDDYANPGWLEKYDGDPRLEWALRELAKWVKEGDGAPECVTTLRKERER